MVYAWFRDQYGKRIRLVRDGCSTRVTLLAANECGIIIGETVPLIDENGGKREYNSEIFLPFTSIDAVYKIQE